MRKTIAPIWCEDMLGYLTCIIKKVLCNIYQSLQRKKCHSLELLHRLQ